MAIVERNLASEMYWRNGLGEILHFHFRKALGRISHVKVLKELQVSWDKTRWYS